MEKAAYYLDRFRQETSPEQRSTLIQDYQDYLKTLPADEQKSVRQFMQEAMRPQLQERIETLDALVEKAELILSQRGKVTYEGKEYVFGDWVTLADYCRLYDFKPSRVQNWIDRRIVPSDNVVVIRELNNLKLIKNQRYRAA
ncbi:hypothetical protein [Spirosoma rhododendri]|uniref:Uncharacterized protein n=1 Tax=Spirosoma rhododendri TaxID=2728024 RepID=A0A7L5DQU7_9BACT|nr:hypothetical protein [Spirosoma rhododendri]QJD79982.1 hypothetical protein HH216_17375 [Spirosoma rhododendri]